MTVGHDVPHAAIDFHGESDSVQAFARARLKESREDDLAAYRPDQVQQARHQQVGHHVAVMALDLFVIVTAEEDGHGPASHGADEGVRHGAAIQL